MILNIIICYNNADEVKSYIESTRGLDCGKSVKFIVVINAVKKEESEIIEKIKGQNVDNMTAREALNFLWELKDSL